MSGKVGKEAEEMRLLDEAIGTFESKEGKS